MYSPIGVSNPIHPHTYGKMTNTKQKSRDNRSKQKNNKKVVVKRIRNDSSNPSRKPAGILRNGLPPGKTDCSYLAALLAPFSSRAYGARVPDDVDIPTCTASIKGFGSVSTDSAGVQGFILRYHPNTCYAYANTSTTAGVISNWAVEGPLNSAGLSSLCAIAGAVRTVGFGVRCQALMPPSTITGNLHVCLVPDIYTGSSNPYALPTGSTQNMVAAMQSQVYYQKIPLASLTMNDMLITGRITDYSGTKFYAPNLGDFNTSSNSNAVLTTSGWMTLVVYVEGANASSKVIEFDTVHHFEYLPSVGTNGLDLQSEQSPVSPAIYNGVKVAARSVPPITTVASGTELADNPSWWSNAVKQMNLGAIASSGLDLLTGNFQSLAIKAARSLTNSAGQKLLTY